MSDRLAKCFYREVFPLDTVSVVHHIALIDGTHAATEGTMGSKSAIVDEHIPAVADSVSRLIEADREPSLCYLHDASRRLRLLREAASSRGLYPPSYGETFDVCMQLVREGLLTYAPPLDAARPWVGSRQLVLTAAGLAALEGAGR